MSTRTSLIADPDGASKELSEGIYGVPLFWIPLMTSNELTEFLEDGLIKTETKAAIARLSDSIEFIAEQFPEIEGIEDTAKELVQYLKKCKSKTIGIDVGEPIEMNPKGFPPALSAAVKGIESRDAKIQFKVGKHTYKSLRDALCIVSTLDPENGVAEEDQLIGELW